jgi:aspartate/tyrosine/aromatic aminotransferase
VGPGAYIVYHRRLSEKPALGRVWRPWPGHAALAFNGTHQSALFAADKGSGSALEAKLAGAIRGNISNSSNLGQLLLLGAYADPAYDAQRAEKYATLKRRYAKMKEVLAAHPEYGRCFSALPVNSGYFMCVRVASGDAEKVRQILLQKHDTGVIAFGDLIRIAFSSTPYAMIDTLMDNIYRACREAGDHA